MLDTSAIFHLITIHYENDGGDVSWDEMTLKYKVFFANFAGLVLINLMFVVHVELDMFCKRFYFF